MTVEPPATNLPPLVTNPISAQTLVVGGEVFTLDLVSAAVFNDPNGDVLTYTASSSAGGVAAVSVEGGVLTAAPVTSGTAEITVSADDGGGGVTPARFTVTVGAGASAFTVEMRVANNGGVEKTMTLGLASGATNGIDAALGEVSLPPLPPAQVFDVRFQIAGGNASLLDLQSITQSEVTWTMQIQGGAGGYPVTLFWDQANLPAGGTFRLQDAITGGDLVDVDMSAQGSYKVTNSAITLLQITFVSSVPSGWTVALNMVDNGASAGTLRFGLALGATDGIDTALNETESPLPSSGSFDVRFTGTGLGNGLGLDLRGPGLTEAVWVVEVQAGSGGFPMTFSWDISAIPDAASLFLQDASTGGSLVNVDMRAEQSYQLNDDAISQLQVAFTAIGVQRFEKTLSAGWSMVSLPVVPGDRTLSALFADALSAFRWTTLYEQVNELNACEGYWVNLQTGGTYTLEAPVVKSCEWTLSKGWSIIGSPWVGVSLDQIVQTPDDNILSLFIWNSQIYQQVTAMQPGFGHWINMHIDGTLSLTSSGAAKPVAVLADEGGFTGAMLWAEAQGRRQEIRLGVEPETLVALPPRPPAGNMDVRVAVGDVETWQVPVSVESQEYRLHVQGEGVALGWEIPAEQERWWQLVVNGEVSDLYGSGQVRVESADEVFVRQSRGPALPQSYFLAQNYPNPFNPATTVHYVLEEAGPVRLKIYDVNGQVVRELVHRWQLTGQYRVMWDGRNEKGDIVANGVYLYELRADDFRAIRKMLMMK